MEHTKEPWKVFDSRGVLEIQDADGGAVVHWVGFDAGDKPKSEKKKNARRIVACVNACAGIPTDLLEKDVNGQIVHMRETMQQRDEQRDRANFYESLNGKQADMLSDVIRQRDELLAVCLSVIHNGIGQADIRAMKAAIAKVQK